MGLEDGVENCSRIIRSSRWSVRMTTTVHSNLILVENVIVWKFRFFARETELGSSYVLSLLWNSNASAKAFCSRLSQEVVIGHLNCSVGVCLVDSQNEWNQNFGIAKTRAKSNIGKKSVVWIVVKLNFVVTKILVSKFLVFGLPAWHWISLMLPIFGLFIRVANQIAP